MPIETPLLSLEGSSKDFYGNTELSDVCFTVWYHGPAYG